MSKLIFTIALLLGSIIFQANASLAHTLSNPTNKPAVVVELTDAKELILEDEKLIRYKLRHQYTLTCSGVRYGVINYSVSDMYRTRLILLSGQEIKTEKRCSVERGQPTKSYYLKANE